MKPVYKPCALSTLNCVILRAPLKQNEGGRLVLSTQSRPSTLNLCNERMKIVSNHSSATHNAIKSTQTITNNALNRGAKSLTNTTSIESQARAIIRYGLEINDPWLP